jgi:hypothetical protein
VAPGTVPSCGDLGTWGTRRLGGTCGGEMAIHLEDDEGLRIDDHASSIEA